jgi:ferric-dicitrate binding protein FerR (iron transport regulator)
MAMSEKAFHISELIQKKLKAEISAEEAIELNEWLLNPENAKVFNELKDENQVMQELEKFDRYDGAKVKDRIKIEAEDEVKVHRLYSRRQRFNWIRIAAAVVILVGAGVSYYTLWQTRHNQPVAIEKPAMASDVTAPNTVNATLTLSNGQKIILDSVGNGTMAIQGGVKVVKLADGQIAYNGESGVRGGDLVYNTLSNPRGSKVVNLTLADGTRVWLNAESSLQYPTTFIGKERSVRVTGEAYFEVAHNAGMPFKVSKGATEVMVLGTHFNVNAYEDEPGLKITLLEGRVMVKRKVSHIYLNPGQQAILSQGQDNIRIANNVNVEEVMAWKNGKFQFGEASDIDAVLRQLSRWYDVDIDYKEAVTGHIGGTISRNVSLSQVMNMLEMTGIVKFKVEGKKVEVTAK